ncbi:Hypothetical protein IALB_2946 [Ignavibacterium album JCM 16511]|uniref:Uncharacterized protein n=1 Tax=Ignavibacterium album (strain DSM 19864 / JCM 16511 / NBRC 101810 / Mat9-16) TaxID=945713 RepID=I0ANU2_IGNAJ|nr:Hypothetical protein IALB_2946 [Ignavibacterium album JCM 16511]
MHNEKGLLKSFISKPERFSTLLEKLKRAGRLPALSLNIFYENKMLIVILKLKRRVKTNSPFIMNENKSIKLT